MTLHKMLPLSKQCGLATLAVFSLFLILVTIKPLFDSSILTAPIHTTACERLFHPLFFTSNIESESACKPLIYNEQLCKRIEAQETEFHKSVVEKPCSQFNVKSMESLSCNKSKCAVFYVMSYPTFCSYLQMVNPEMTETANTSRKLFNEVELQEFISFIYKKKDCGLGNCGFCMMQCFSIIRGMDLIMYHIKLEGLHSGHYAKEHISDNQAAASLNIIFFKGLSRAQFFRRFRSTINELENFSERLLDFPRAQSSSDSLDDAFFLEILQSLSEQETIMILPPGTSKNQIQKELATRPSKTFTFQTEEMSHIFLQRPIKRSCLVELQNKYVSETFKVMSANLDLLRFLRPIHIISLLNPKAEISTLDKDMAETMRFYKTLHNGLTFLLSSHGSLWNVENSVYSRLELSNPMFLVLVPAYQKKLFGKLEKVTSKMINPKGVTRMIRELTEPQISVDLNLIISANYQNMAVTEPFLCICQNEPVTHSNNSIYAMFASMLLSKYGEQTQDEAMVFNGMKQKYTSRNKLSGLYFDKVEISHVNNDIHLSLEVTGWDVNSLNAAEPVPVVGRLVVKDTQGEIEVSVQSVPAELFTGQHYTTDSWHQEKVFEVGHFHVAPDLHSMHSDCVLLIVHNYVYSVLYEAVNVCHYESYKVTFTVTSRAMVTSGTNVVTLHGMDVKTVGYAACLVQVHLTIPRVSYEYQISEINTI